jgi:hypothetical protein
MPAEAGVWEIVGWCIAYLITGMVMWFLNVRALAGRGSCVIDDISALIMLAGMSSTSISTPSGSPAFAFYLCAAFHVAQRAF